MLVLPRIEPNRIDDYGGFTTGVEQFQSSAGLVTSIQRTCQPFGFSFSVQYEALKPDQACVFFDWFLAIGLDFRSQVSHECFKVPCDHPFWKKIAIKECVEKFLVPDQTIDNARWQLVEPSTMKVPYCNLHNINFRIENVYR